MLRKAKTIFTLLGGIILLVIFTIAAIIVGTIFKVLWGLLPSLVIGGGIIFLLYLFISDYIEDKSNRHR